MMSKDIYVKVPANKKKKYNYKIDTSDNVFEITDLSGKSIIKMQMDEELDQVIITTPKEVYAGPVDLISFKEDVK